MKIQLAGIGIAQAGAAPPASLARDLRRADRFISMAVHAGFAAIGDRPAGSAESGRHGLALGTAFGPMQTNFEVLDQVVHGQQTSPTLFSHSVFNAAAGYLSRIFGLTGEAVTITDFAFPFFQALHHGAIAISSGRLDSCLVLQVETYSELFSEARSRILGSGFGTWHAGAVAWLLRKESDRPIAEISSIDVRLRPTDGTDYLQINEALDAANDSSVATDPLGSAAAMTSIFARFLPGRNVITITADHGRIEIGYQGGFPG